MYSIGIIINPNAKRIRRSRENLPDLLRRIGGEYVRVFETPQIDDIKAVLTTIKNDGISIVAICGGDGTIHQVLTGIIHVWGRGNLPRVLILPCGTMNNVARTLSMKGKGPSVLERVIRKIRSGEELTTSIRFTMEVENRYCFLFGCGFTSHFLDAVYGGIEKGIIQNCRVIGTAVKDIITMPDGGPLFRPLRGKLAANGILLPFTSITGILAGTVEHIGMGFSPMPRGAEPGTFQAIVTGMGPRDILKNLNRLRTGRKIKHSLHWDIMGRHLLLKSIEPFRYTMDGDMYTSEGQLEVKLGPAITLIKA